MTALAVIVMLLLHVPHAKAKPTLFNKVDKACRDANSLVEKFREKTKIGVISAVPSACLHGLQRYSDHVSSLLSFFHLYPVCYRVESYRMIMGRD